MKYKNAILALALTAFTFGGASILKAESASQANNSCQCTNCDCGADCACDGDVCNCEKCGN